MRILFITAIALAFSIQASAQTCRIKIYYDANGNRTQRIMECGPGATGPSKKSEVSNKGNLFNELNANTFQVYPIPAESKVNIRLDAALLEKGCDLVMTDISGKTIFQKKNIQETISEVDLRGLTDGAYLIQIISGTERRTVKIVKQTGNGY